jgi:disulfide bond formation protein DsbB
VYIDGNKLDYTVTATENSWILTFNYHHSTHQITIALAANATTEPTILGVAYWIWAAVASIIIAAGIVCFTIWRTKKKEKT